MIDKLNQIKNAINIIISVLSLYVVNILIVTHIIIIVKFVKISLLI